MESHLCIRVSHEQILSIHYVGHNLSGFFGIISNCGLLIFRFYEFPLLELDNFRRQENQQFLLGIVRGLGFE